jgi:uncharacterized membrane protein
LKHARWRDRAQRLATTLWVVPALAAGLALTLAKAISFVDHSIPQSREAWYLFAGQAESARELLSTIASSLMTFTGVVFSITILVLQLASSQYSPRVLPTFLEDRATRFSMGVFIGSFVYAMALLPEVRTAGAGGPEFVPALAIFVAFVLVLVSVAVFAHYISRMAQSIRVIRIVRRIAESTQASMDELFPADRSQRPEPRPESPPVELARVIAARGGGVVSSVDESELVGLAVHLDAVIEVVPKVGDFVPRGAALLRLWTGRPIDSKRAEEMVHCVVIADERTVHQDPGFGVRQLVDIAERALSPGVNDPTTAVQVLDQIHDLLRTLATRSFPSGAHRDSAGTLRVMLAHPGWDDFVHMALDEIRQYGQGSIHVSRRMRAVLEDLLAVAPVERRAVIREQRELLDGAIERGFPSPRERALSRMSDAHDA